MAFILLLVGLLQEVTCLTVPSHRLTAATSYRVRSHTRVSMTAEAAITAYRIKFPYDREKVKLPDFLEKV